LAFCFALGFDALVLRWRRLAPLGVVWLAGWALLAWTTFVANPARLGPDPLAAQNRLDWGGWLQRSDAALAAGRREEGIALLQRSLEVDPDQGAMGEALANLLRSAGRDREALAAARAALRAAPAGQSLHMLTGELYLAQGEPEAAAYHFALAARL